VLREGLRRAPTERKPLHPGQQRELLRVLRLGGEDCAAPGVSHVRVKFDGSPVIGDQVRNCVSGVRRRKDKQPHDNQRESRVLEDQHPSQVAG
jgi:hypothetical protein